MHRLIKKLVRPFYREPDFIIGGREDPYMLRWWVIPKNRFFNVYLHKFMRSDDDRALHDHPWAFNMSILLRGEYIEHMPQNPATYCRRIDEIMEDRELLATEKDVEGLGRACAKNPEHRDMRTITRRRRAPFFYFRWGNKPHRVELLKTYEDFIPRMGLSFVNEIPCWTLFITGPNVRIWGFWCPKGWRPWQEYVDKRDGASVVGRGCDD